MVIFDDKLTNSALLIDYLAFFFPKHGILNREKGWKATANLAFQHRPLGRDCVIELLNYRFA